MPRIDNLSLSTVLLDIDSQIEQNALTYTINKIMEGVFAEYIGKTINARIRPKINEAVMAGLKNDWETKDIIANLRNLELRWGTYKADKSKWGGQTTFEVEVRLQYEGVEGRKEVYVKKYNVNADYIEAEHKSQFTDGYKTNLQGARALQEKRQHVAAWVERYNALARDMAALCDEATQYREDQPYSRLYPLSQHFKYA